MELTTPTRGGKKQEQSNTELTVAEKKKQVGQSKRASNNEYDSESTISNSSATSLRKNRKGKESPICASKLNNNHVDDYMNKRKLEKEKEEGKSEEFSESDEGDNEIVNYQCPSCIFSCLTYTQFCDHMLMKHSKSVFCCVTNECINWFLSQNGLRQHCKKCHAETLGCTECGLVCLSPTLLSTAKETTHRSNKGICPSCNRSFTCLDDAKRHHKKNCPKNPDRCISCKICLKQGHDPDIPGAEAGLIAHLVSVHGMEGNYLCMWCHRVFTSIKKLDSYHTVCSKNRPEKFT